ncbi:MAG: AI-2E family transporter [Candidatus Binataceae bacterium]
MDRERIIQLFFFGFLAVMAYELYLLLAPFLVPIAWGILLAFIAQPAFTLVDKYVKSRSLAAIILTVAVGLGVVLPAIWLSSLLVGEAQTLYVQVTAQVKAGMIVRLEQWAMHSDLFGWIAARLSEHGYKLSKHLPELTMNAARTVSNYVVENATQAARNAVTFVIDFGFALFAFFYFLRDGEYYYESLRELAPMHDEDKNAVFDTLRSTLSAVMRGLMLTAALQGVTVGLGLLIFGVPYSIFLALVSAVAGLLPIGGTAIVWVPAAAWLAYASGWPHAIGLVIWCTISVAVIDNFIKPMAMKHGTHLPTFALFLGIMGGLEAYGPLGLFAGPAIMSVFAALLQVYRKTYARPRKEAA